MPEESKPERADEETSASETRKEVVHSDDPRESIYEKYDAIKKAREEAEAAPAEEESGETPPKEASVPEEKTEAEVREEGILHFLFMLAGCIMEVVEAATPRPSKTDFRRKSGSLFLIRPERTLSSFHQSLDFHQYF